MKVERSYEECWALSTKFDHKRSFLNIFCWGFPIEPSKIGVALFETRKEARKAQKTCGYRKMRIEKVCVTVKAIE